MKTTNKEMNKDNRITVRLTPYLDFELKRLAEEMNVPKAKLVRYFIDYFLKLYSNADK